VRKKLFFLNHTIVCFKFQLKNHFISKMHLLNKEQKEEIAKDAFKKNNY